MAPKPKQKGKTPRKSQAKTTDPPQQGKKIIKHFNFNKLKIPHAKVIPVYISLKKHYSLETKKNHM